MVQWVVGSIPHGGPIQVNVLQCNKGCGMCCPIRDGAYIPWCQLERVAHVVAAVGFLSHYLSGPLPYIWHHITIIKCVECFIKKTHFLPSSSQCSTASVTKAVVCAILSVRWCYPVCGMCYPVCETVLSCLWYVLSCLWDGAILSVVCAILSVRWCYPVCEMVLSCLWYVLSCLWDGAYKRSLAVNQKE